MRGTPAAKGTRFLNIEDETDMVNVVVPPPVADAHVKPAVDHAALLIHGHTERTGNALSLIAHHLEPPLSAHPLATDSPVAEPDPIRMRQPPSASQAIAVRHGRRDCLIYDLMYETLLASNNAATRLRCFRWTAHTSSF